MEKVWSEKLERSFRIDLFLLILFILVGGFLRSWNLGVASFWVDEVNTVFAAESLVETGRHTLPSGYGYVRAPLHTYIVAGFYYLFGVSEATSRLPSALFGLFSILLVYLLGRKVYNRRVGLLSAFFMTFSHFEVGWSRTTRMYTLLQFLTLLIIYCFIEGFEQTKQGKHSSRFLGQKFSFFSRAVHFLKHYGLSPLWLVVCTFLIWVSAFRVHLLTLFLLGGIFVYLLSVALASLLVEKGSGRVMNKYLVSSFVAILVAVLAWIASPGLREMTNYFLSYTPSWAMDPSSAQRRFRLFEFLISPQRFPLAAFFFVGGIQMITRKQKLGWLFMWGFLVPLFLLTFVFTHRVSTYLFYVYPFFLIISAFGFINLLESEGLGMRKDLLLKRRWVKKGVFALFLSIFFFSPWLRITLHIPFFEDGVTNLAVTPNEWREASQIVKERRKDDDLIVSSLPQVALYYGIRSDYGLNWVNLNLAREEEFKNEAGRWRDVYAGVVCIESLDDLKEIIQTHSRGWILVTKYHLEHVIVIPADVREFVEEFFEEPLRTKNGTVLIYHWLQESELES